MPYISRNIDIAFVWGPIAYTSFRNYLVKGVNLKDIKNVGTNVDHLG